MRTAAVLYIVISVGANFWYGNLTTFVLASFSFPVLLWLLLRRKKTTAAPKPPPHEESNKFNTRVAS